MTCCVNDADTVPLDTLLRHVAIRVPELPYTVAMDLVRQKYVEFARRSGLLVSYVELPIQRDVRNYFLEAPEGYEVFGVRGAGCPHLWQWAVPTPNSWFISWGHRFQVKGNREVIFDAFPSVNQDGKYLLLTVVPSPCADTIPTEVETPYGMGIAAGAVMEALNMPNKAWSNPNLARTFERTYNIAVMAAKNLAITNRGAVSPQFKAIRIL